MRNVPPSSKMHFSMGGWLLGRLATNGRAAALLGASFAGAAVTRSRGCEHLPCRIAPIPGTLGTDPLFRFFCSIAVSLPFAESLLQANSFKCLGKSLVARVRELEGETTQPMYGTFYQILRGREDLLSLFMAHSISLRNCDASIGRPATRPPTSP